MKRTRFAIALVAATLAAGACSPLFTDDVGADDLHVGFVMRHGDQVRGTGRVEWFELGGGFFAIRGDDGKVYAPLHLPAAFQEDGARVAFEARLRPDLLILVAAGELVELRHITGA
jgi:hypothetical protein